MNGSIRNKTTTYLSEYFKIFSFIIIYILRHIFASVLLLQYSEIGNEDSATFCWEMFTLYFWGYLRQLLTVSGDFYHSFRDLPIHESVISGMKQELQQNFESSQK